jgi:hypothetical protein
MQNEQRDYLATLDEVLTAYQDALKDPVNYALHSARLYITFQTMNGWTVAQEDDKSQILRMEPPGPDFANRVSDTSNWQNIVRKLEKVKRRVDEWWIGHFSSNRQFVCSSTKTFEKELKAYMISIGEETVSLEELHRLQDRRPRRECPNGNLNQEINVKSLSKKKFLQTGFEEAQSESQDYWHEGVPSSSSRKLMGRRNGNPPPYVANRGDAQSWGPTAHLCCSADKPYYVCQCPGITPVTKCKKCYCSSTSSKKSVKAKINYGMIGA